MDEYSEETTAQRRDVDRILRELEESEERFRILSDSTSEGIAIHRGGRLLEVNKAFCDLFGSPAEELKGSDGLDLVDEEFKDVVRENIKRGFNEPYEAVFRRRDGTRFLGAVWGKNTTYKGHKARVTTVRDMTKEREAQEQVLRMKARFEAVFEALPDLCFIVDSQGVIVDYQAARPSDLYVPPQVFSGRRMQDVLPPETGELIGEAFSRVLSTRLLVTLEYSLPMPQGEKWYEGRLTPLPEAHILMVVRDITERRRMEQELLAERDRARSYLDVANVIILALNSEGEVALINRKGCEVLGYSEMEILGKSFFEYFVPRKARKDVERVFHLLMAGEVRGVDYYENPVYTKDGKLKVIGWYNTLLRDKSGAVTGTLSSGEDITARIAAVEKLKEISRALSGC
jgi:PAS domain S-box-containing protein